MKKFLIGLLCFVVVIAICILTQIGFRNYYSNFAPEKWMKHEHHRYSMVKSLESQYNIVGMTENEIVELLGEPDIIGDWNLENQYRYEYLIGDDGLDAIIYRIILENGVVVNSGTVHT